MEATTETTPSTPPTYASHSAGLQEAADDYDREKKTPVEKVPAPEGDEDLTPRKAADALTKWRADNAADRAELEKALGLDATPEEEPQESRPDKATREADSAREKFEDNYESSRRRLAESAETASRLHHATTDAAQLVIQEWQRAYPDVQTPDDFHALRLRDPVRAAQAEGDLARVHMEIDALGRHQAEAAEIAHVEFQNWARYEDQAFAERYSKEMSNPKVATEIRSAAIAMLKDEGFTDEQLAKAWHGGGMISLRSSAAQAILLDACRYRLSQQKLKSAPRDKPLPPVKPGVSRGKGGATDDTVRAASKRLDKTGSLRDAARLYDARRGA